MGAMTDAGVQCVEIEDYAWLWVRIPSLATKILWGGMFQGGETALQAICGEFDSHPLHMQLSYRGYY